MDDRIELLLKLIPALPLASAVFTALLGPRVLRSQSHILTIAAIIGSCICSFMLIGEVRRQHAAQPSDVGFEKVVTLWTWANVDSAYSQPVTPPGDATSSASDGGIRDFRIDIALRADALTAMMLTMVTFIASLVAIFAAGYMHGDRGYWRFFSYVSLFVFSMTMLVSVSNFVLLFVFWEAVGACSYLLIGFWYHKPEAAAAGKKAFLVNRVGDFGFALALFLIWTTYGTLNFHDTSSTGNSVPTASPSGTEAVSSLVATEGVAVPKPVVVRGVLGQSRIRANDYVAGCLGLAICLLLMLGACGKSAQFPLHVWLPDAMEGPTPVSALIHAATMVTAGVYMVTRCTPLFMASPEAQWTVAGIGGITALMAGLIAVTQFDLKRVLAYSTVSQLGFMFLALGTGTLVGITSGMFHLFTHAFFKALLFLGAGSVMHAMGNIIDMRRFGGLRRLMPVTHWTFFIGCLALAGVPPFAGFWSKDSIVASLHDKAHELSHELEHREAHPGQAMLSNNENGPFVFTSTMSNVAASNESSPASPLAKLSNSQLATGRRVYQCLYYGALFTALLTAFYTFRAFFMTFYGEERIPHEAGHHAHESPPMMYWPLIVLALFAFGVGLFFDRTAWGGSQDFSEFLRTAPSLAAGAVAQTTAPGHFHFDVAGLSTLIAFAGIGAALYLYLGENREIRWLSSLMNLEGLSRCMDAERVSRMKQIGWVSAIHSAARKVGLGWITAALGYLFMFVALILSAPLLIGYYISPYRLSYRKFFWDEIYEVVFVKPLHGLAQLCYLFDRWVVDGTVNLFGRLPGAVGSVMRSLQMGLVQFYALAMVLGAIILIAARMLWASG